MLEILLLVALSRKIHAIAKEKGHGGALYVVLFILLWIGGEVGGFIAGVVMAGGGEPGLEMYLFALVGAAIGAGIAFAIVGSLPSVKTEPEYDDRDDRGDRRDAGRGVGGGYREKFEDRQPRREDEPGYQKEKPENY